MRERIFLAPVDEVPGVQVFGVDASARLWKAYHEAFDVCTCLPSVPRAASEWRYRRRDHTTRPGGLMMMEPGEPHSTTGVHGVGTFRVLLIEPRLMLEAAHELGMHGALHLSVAHCDDPTLFRAFSRLHTCLQDPQTTAVERQSRFASGLRLLLQRCAENPAASVPRDCERLAARRARELIHERFATHMTLDELSQATRVSRFHLARLFAREVGLPPHQYLLLVRAERARELLTRGMSPAEAAVETGFVDQSHLTRHFNRVWGITPAAFRAACSSARRRSSVLLPGISIALASDVPADSNPRFVE